MGKKIKETVYLDLLKWDELDTLEKDLIFKAKQTVDNAYAPYSNFKVGAALLLENGEILTSNNQENASFPVGICAERILLAYAHANYPDQKPLKIALVARRKGDAQYATVSPCGLCRQSINEYELKFKHPIEILMLTPGEEILKAKSIGQLLPFKFNDLTS